MVSPAGLPSQLPSSRAALAADIDAAQATIDDPASLPPDLAQAGTFQQLATAELERVPKSARRATLALLGAEAAAGMRTNLDAATALARLSEPRRHLPPWRIADPPPPTTLLRYFRAAQARFGIRWQYLAAIEFIETKFGRIHGTSSAGAQGPMQFLPSTWAQYGRGNIANPRDAILGAARYLRANGAPGDIAGALYAYNNSFDYVRAVTDYARAMIARPRAYYGYYEWQVLFARPGGTVLLPVGYPRIRPVRIVYPSLR